jgi:anthranilate synthase component 2
MRLAMIDNYDSFTYNLVQYLGELGAQVEVFRNDAIGVEALLARRPQGVVISPGPGAQRSLPLLGVCLGHQAIGLAFGGRIVRARSVMHGKLSSIHHDGRGLFAGIENPFEATRYHSLVIDPESCPAVLEVTAHTADGEIMGVRHRQKPIEGVQFHPESILTRVGKPLLQRFLESCARGAAG